MAHASPMTKPVQGRAEWKWYRWVRVYIWTTPTHTRCFYIRKPALNTPDPNMSQNFMPKWGSLSFPSDFAEHLGGPLWQNPHPLGTPIAVAQSASGLCSKGPPEAHGLEYSSRMKVAIASTTAEAIIASILKNETKGNVDCAKNVATCVWYEDTWSIALLGKYWEKINEGHWNLLQVSGLRPTGPKYVQRRGLSVSLDKVHVHFRMEGTFSSYENIIR